MEPFRLCAEEKYRDFAQVGVHLMTFDNVEELEKIVKLHYAPQLAMHGLIITFTLQEQEWHDI